MRNSDTFSDRLDKRAAVQAGLGQAPIARASDSVCPNSIKPQTRLFGQKMSVLRKSRRSFEGWGPAWLGRLSLSRLSRKEADRPDFAAGSLRQAGRGDSVRLKRRRSPRNTVDGRDRPSLELRDEIRNSVLRDHDLRRRGASPDRPDRLCRRQRRSRRSEANLQAIGRDLAGRRRRPS